MVRKNENCNHPWLQKNINPLIKNVLRFKSSWKLNSIRSSFILLCQSCNIHSYYSFREKYSIAYLITKGEKRPVSVPADVKRQQWVKCLYGIIIKTCMEYVKSPKTFFFFVNLGKFNNAQQRVVGLYYAHICTWTFDRD